MPRTIGKSIAFVIGMSVLAAGARAQDAPNAPAEQYQALLKEYQVASSGGPMTDEERLQFVGRSFQVRDQLGMKLVDLAEQYPDDSVAVDALIMALWQVNTTPWPIELVGEEKARPRAIALLMREYITSDKLGDICQRISYGFCEEYEAFLRAVLAENPHRNVQAMACLGLGRFLSNRLHRLDLVAEQPALATEFEGLFGKEYLEELQQQDRATADREAEHFFELAAEEYGDVVITGVGTVAEKVDAELFEIRHLRVGTVAPDIEGVDLDGVTFRLSDYRGRVVLLDFWHEY